MKSFNESPSIDMILPKPKSVSTTKQGCVNCGLDIISPGITREDIMNSPSYQMILPNNYGRVENGLKKDRIRKYGIFVYLPNEIILFNYQHPNENTYPCKVDLKKLNDQNKFFKIVYAKIELVYETKDGKEHYSNYYYDNPDASNDISTSNYFNNKWLVINRGLEDILSKHSQLEPNLRNVFVQLKLELPCIAECCRKKLDNPNPNSIAMQREIGKPIVVITFTAFPHTKIDYNSRIDIEGIQFIALEDCVFNQNCGLTLDIDNEPIKTGLGEKG